jgi:hypothetical protein
MTHHVPAYGPDPYDASIWRHPLDHVAFYEYGAPFRGDVEDTGLRCRCGREVVAVDFDESPTGWAHVGVGDKHSPLMEIELEVRS